MCLVRINVHQSLQLSIFEKRMKLTINFLSLFQSENSFLSANFTFRDDGADKAFIEFIEASDLETAQKAFLQSCKAINLEPCGTIDTFYTSYRETMKVHKSLFPPPNYFGNYYNANFSDWSSWRIPLPPAFPNRNFQKTSMVIWYATYVVCT